MGTTFRVQLPTATEPLGAPSSKRFADAGRRGRVLVIDDEPSILSTIRRSLEKSHDVSATLDPREALLRFEQGQRFDVTFCDLMMPHLSGDALYERVKLIAPDQAERFVFITGAASEPRVHGFLAQVPNERLEKPFDVQNLRGIVRRCVRARTSIPAPAA